MSIARLERDVEQFFRAHAHSFGLQRDDVQAAYRLNHGGFVNASFRVSDGRSRFFLKLAGQEDESQTGFDTRAGMRQWHALAGRLADHYHAPRILDQVTLPDGRDGLLFEWVDGETPARLAEPLSTEMFGVLERLHADHELARRLPAGGTCADAYAGSLHDRFTEDLAHVRRYRPPFVDDDRLAWMEAQVARFAVIVATSAAFRAPANSPVHGDLWLENVLVTTSGAWYLLDWDDLRLGDPAADLATLLGPTPAVIEPAELPARLPAYMDDAARARFEIHRRAVLLDWIIDPLADWIEAACVPAHAASVRREKQQAHETALAVYLTTPG